MEKHSALAFSVSFYHRKPFSVGNYSVEFIFDDVRKRLKDKIESRIYYSRFPSSGVLKRLYNCWQAIFQQSDVNHITGDINYLGIFLNKHRTVQTILDCVHLEFTTGIKHFLLKLFWAKIPISRCRYVTAISESTKREILKYVHCDPDKIVVIPVAISSRFQPKPKEFNKLKPILLQIGTAPNKNIPRLIEAIRDIPCTLQIIGKHNAEYEELLKQNHINYLYTSGLNDEQILEKYEMADIICFSSTYEGFGMPILEGQAVGRPVVTSNILSMPEVAGDGAHLVDPIDVQSIRKGILKIIEDDAYRESLVQRGFENVKRFDPENIANMYYALYQKTASK